MAVNRRLICLNSLTATGIGVGEICTGLKDYQHYVPVLQSGVYHMIPEVQEETSRNCIHMHRVFISPFKFSSTQHTREIVY